MQRNNNTILLLTVLLGLVAIGGAAFLFLRPSSSPTPPPDATAVVAAVPTPTPKPTSVLLATRDIPPRTVVTPGMFRTSFVQSDAPDDAISNVSDIVGRISDKPIHAGQPLRKSAFTNELERVIPANFQVPTGTRAVALWVDPNTTAAGLVDVGDRVDVIANHRLTWDKQNNQAIIGSKDFTAGRTIGRNLLVLAVDKSINTQPTPVPTPTPVGAAPAAPPPPPPAATPLPPVVSTRVVVAASPATAAMLVAANDSGKLHITIRNPLDTDNAPVPEAREYPSRLITVYPRNGGGSGDGGGRQPRFIEPDLPPVSTGNNVPTVPMTPDLPPLAPPAPTTQDVTVIRGTDKAKVTVPVR